MCDRSVPFLLKPKNLGGMVGDIGFDPLGLSEYIDIRFLREGELKNGAFYSCLFARYVVSFPWQKHGHSYSVHYTVVGGS